MLQPARTKFRKAHKGRIKGKATRGASLNFGSHGLQALEPEELLQTNRSCKGCSNKTDAKKREGLVTYFSKYSSFKKPIEVRMGKGKGSPEYWVYRVKPGRIIFEIDGVNDTVAKESFDRAASKLPIKTKIVKRNLNI